MQIKGASLNALARSFHLDLSTRAPCHLSEILDHAIEDGSRWVAEGNGWMASCRRTATASSCVLRPRVAVRLALQGGRAPLAVAGRRRAVGPLMAINYNDYFENACDGRLVVTLDSRSPDSWSRFGDDSHALDHLMDGLRFEVSDDDIRDNRVGDPEDISSESGLIEGFAEAGVAAELHLAQRSRTKPISWALAFRVGVRHSLAVQAGGVLRRRVLSY